MHPNATAAGLSALVASGVVWLADHVWHVELSASNGALIAGALATFVLWIGRRGIAGAARDVWRGIGSNGQPEKAPPAAPIDTG